MDKMDIEQDAIREAHDSILGSSRDGFKQWLLANTEYGDHLINTVFAVQDSKLEYALRERFWEEYIADLDTARQAERERG